jgi:16S rRNA (guanine966-N2)-methyltransferase
MRIISGKFKGRRLANFDEEHIRPTTDRVKESLFNIISANIQGARVLDLFSGTGNLGFESLSRGASEVQMVELSQRSIKLIQQNIKLLGVTENLILHKSDAVKFLNSYEDTAFDVVLVDPPFPALICLKTLEALNVSPAVNNETLIAIEHATQEPLPQVVGNLTRFDRRDYGDKLLDFYQKEKR